MRSSSRYRPWIPSQDARIIGTSVEMTSVPGTLRLNRLILYVNVHTYIYKYIHMYMYDAWAFISNVMLKQSTLIMERYSSDTAYR